MRGEAVPPAKAALVQLNEQFEVREQLGIEPVLLERTPDNAGAYAHALHLASYEFPESFGCGYKTFPVMNTKLTFMNSDVTTYGVGEGHQLQAGISVHIAGSVAGAWGSDYGLQAPPPRIELLFKHQALKDLSVGRNLARTALTHVIERGGSEVTVSVTSANVVMRRAYERFGFHEVARTEGSGCKIIKMLLSGRPKLIAARNKLENQL